MTPTRYPAVASMSAPPPSFSSFPPTFSSFPDIEAGPSKSKKDTSVERDKQEKVKHKRDKRDQDKHRERRKKDRHNDEDERRRKKSKKNRDGRDTYSDDDRVPKSRDNTRNSSALPEDLTYRSFYSDRKGDILNVTYGGIHAGDVPKYRLLAGKH